MEFLDWLGGKNLVLTTPPLIFYTPPQRECEIHIDGNNIHDRVNMNWIVGGRGSQMHWYELVPGTEITTDLNTEASTPYTRYAEDQVMHLHSQPVNWPSIVQSGIPHKITNYCNQPRWCLNYDISLKLYPKAGLTMIQAREIFEQWIA